VLAAVESALGEAAAAAHVTIAVDAAAGGLILAAVGVGHGGGEFRRGRGQRGLGGEGSEEEAWAAEMYQGLRLEQAGGGESGRKGEEVAELSSTESSSELCVPEPLIRLKRIHNI
jgi:hypothetical protein